MYDVEHRDLYLIKSRSGLSWKLALMPGESVAGLGSVKAAYIGRRVIIRPDDPAEREYQIDYDENSDVMDPVMMTEIGNLIKDLTAIGCCEYTPDLLRAIQQRKTELKPWEVDHRLRL